MRIFRVFSVCCVAGDISLLSGYHLLGVDRPAQARMYLARAALDRHNEHAAGVLVDLLDERWK